MSFGGRKKFLIDYFAVGIAMVFFSLRPLVLIPIITRRMGMEAYGVWAQVVTTATFLGPVLTLRLMSALSRYLSGTARHHDLSRCYLFGGMAVLSGGVVLLLVTAMAPRVISGFVFGDSDLTVYVWPAMCYSITSGLLVMAQSYYYTNGRGITYSIMQSIWLIGDCILAFFVSYTGSIATCIYTLSGWELVICLFTYMEIIRRHGWAKPSISGFPKIWRFAGYMMLNHWIFFLASNASKYVIVALLGLELVGIYQVTFQVAAIVGLISTPTQYVLMPMLSAAWNSGAKKQLIPLARLAYLMQMLLGLPLIAVLLQLGEYLINLLSRKASLPSPYLLLLLLAATFMYGLYQVSSQACRLTGKFTALQVITLVSGVLNIGLPFLLIPKFGLIGAGIAYCASMIFMSVLQYKESVPILGTMDWLRGFKAFILGAMLYVFLFPVHYLGVGDLGKLLAGAGIAVVVYIAGFFALRFYSMNDLRQAFAKLRARPAVNPVEETVCQEQQ